VGDVVPWTITIVNNGLGDADDLVVGENNTTWALDTAYPADPNITNVSVAGFTVTKIAAGDTVTIHVTTVVTQAELDNKLLENSLTVEGITVNPVKPELPVLTTAKTYAGKTTELVAGDRVPWTIAITNSGLGEAKNLVVTENNATWQLAAPSTTDANITSVTATGFTVVSIPAGATVTIRVTTEVTQVELDNKLLENSVTVEGATTPGTGSTLHLLTINYMYATGGVAAPSYSDLVVENSYYDVASPAIPGYTPSELRVAGTMPASNVTTTVVYSVHSGTAYTVQHYLIATSGAITLGATQHLSATTGDTVTAYPLYYSGYTPVSGYPSVLSGVVAGDGSLVLSVYYTQNVPVIPPQQTPNVIVQPPNVIVQSPVVVYPAATPEVTPEPEETIPDEDIPLGPPTTPEPASWSLVNLIMGLAGALAALLLLISIIARQRRRRDVVVDEYGNAPASQFDFGIIVMLLCLVPLALFLALDNLVGSMATTNEHTLIIAVALAIVLVLAIVQGVLGLRVAKSNARFAR
jgi:hypothetical protein